MNELLRQEFEAKTVSAQDAAKMVKSGDTVYLGTCSSVAYTLCDALSEREDELEDVTLACALVIRPSSLLSDKPSRAFRTLTYFMGAQERRGLAVGKTDFTSVHLSQLDIWCRETAHPDVVFLEVSAPDENGYMSFGANGVALNTYLLDTARTVVLQVNKNAPYVYGEYNLIHISKADAVVFCDQEIAENPNLPISSTIQTISDFILEQIPDGACIQLGLGGVANAVGYGLVNKNDLGGHTELMTDSMMDLMKMGVMNNSRKTHMPGKTVAGFAFGSKALYKFIDHNPDMYFLPLPIVNDPVIIAKNDNMISVNNAISIDLMGQVNADNIAGRQYSATGGQLDYVRGAQMSKGGKSFIAITSTVDNKKTGPQSRIVSHFPMGTCVTTPRSDVQYVVTEFGCVNLKPLSMKDRVRAMISLAHPDFRPQLTADAKTAGLL